MNRNEYIIEVKDLYKEFRTAKREPGVMNAVRTLFKKSYEKKVALNNVSFRVNKGEILGFIGPNGAGKSTTIKALSGVLHPTSGEVRVLGYIPWKERESYVANIGVVFGQKPQLWWDLPAKDSFVLNKDIYGVPDREFEERMNYMVGVLGLTEMITTPVRDLSLGERMKCKLVAALLHNPKLVFLDEPSIGLDVIAKNTMRALILKMNQEEGTTFIITTHDMQDIERLCKRIIIINHGDIVYDGSLEAVKKRVSNAKVIDVKLETEHNEFVHEGAKVIESGPYELKIEVDGNSEKGKVKTIIDYLLKHYEVADINITDPPIEEIIERIYNE